MTKQKFIIVNRKRKYLCQYKNCKNIADHRWSAGYYCTRHIEKLFPAMPVIESPFWHKIIDEITDFLNWLKG